MKEAGFSAPSHLAQSASIFFDAAAKSVLSDSRLQHIPGGNISLFPLCMEILMVIVCWEEKKRYLPLITVFIGR